MTTEQQAMSDEERQKKLEQCFAKYAIVGYLKDGKTFDGCIIVDDLSFKKELEKFSDVIKVYRLTEIHKRWH